MQAWNGWIDKTMRRIINETVEHFKEHDITFDQVVEMINCTFGVMFYCIRDKRMPTVNFKNSFAVFSPSPSKLLRKIRSLLKKGHEDIEEIADLQKTYYRIRTEENRRMYGKKLNNTNKLEDGTGL